MEREDERMAKNLWKYAVIAVLLALLLVLAPSPVSTYDAFAEIVELDMKGVGMPINWDNYTSDTHYEDPSLTVDIVWGGRIYETNYVYALVKIANGTQIRTAMAGDQYSGEYTAIGSTIGKSKNAVFAINGDYFKHSDHQNGFMVRQGKTYRNRPSKMWDLLMIDQYGDFHTIVEPDKDKLAAWQAEHADLQIVNSFNFGPVMILDGQVTRADFDEIQNHRYIGTHKEAQRMAVCQLDKLTYLCVTSEGPEDKGSTGLTMDQFAECLQEIDEQLTDYTIQVAYNLDGGSSCTMVFKDPEKNALKKINAPTNPKVRYLSDILYFASAYQE